MPTVTVKLMRLRQAPRKVRLLVDLIRGKHVKVAEAQLMAVPKRAALPVAKLLKSAEVAAGDHGLNVEHLWVATATVDQGSALKRRMINSRGRGSMVKKFFSHITLTVSDNAPKGRPDALKAKTKTEARRTKPSPETKSVEEASTEVSAPVASE